MRLLEWLRPGLHIKRWLLLGILGVLFISIALAGLFSFIFNGLNIIACIIFFLLGSVCLGFSVKHGFISLFSLCSDDRMRLDRSRMNKALYDNRIRARGPKIAVIGGGTGLSVLLRGLKLYTSNITAIVTVADDGGGSGKLREDLGMLPPGDIRNCILALAEMEPTMEKLFQYRFEEGSLKGQSFGNLLIAAMNGISHSFEDAIKKISDVLAVTGSVIPVTLEDITLFAELENGGLIKGESNIPLKSMEEKSRIKRVYIEPEGAVAMAEAIAAISQADAVILGPGSLYTSIIPNLLIQGIQEALEGTPAMKIYIPNIMTQPGETDGYSICRHLEAIQKHAPELTIDYVAVNRGSIPHDVREKYLLEGAELIQPQQEDIDCLLAQKIRVIEGSFIDIKNQYVRHDAAKLSKVIVNEIQQQRAANEKRSILDRLLNREAAGKRS